MCKIPNNYNLMYSLKQLQDAVIPLTLNTNWGDVTKEIKKALNKYLPIFKFSVSKGNYGEIYVEIKEGCFNYNFNYHKNSIWHDKDNEDIMIKAVITECEKMRFIVNTIKEFIEDNISVTHMDLMSNILDSYHYSYVEPTTEMESVLSQFNMDYQQKLIDDTAKAKKEYEARQLESERQEKEYKEYQIMKKGTIEDIYNNISITDIAEDEQELLSNVKYANINKNNTIEQYTEQIKNNEYYFENTKIGRVINFTNADLYNKFSHMLLTDFDFLQGMGGDEINEATGKSNIWNAVGVQLDNELMYIIDSQGFNYARYVGLL